MRRDPDVGQQFIGLICGMGWHSNPRGDQQSIIHATDANPGGKLAHPESMARGTREMYEFLDDHRTVVGFHGTTAYQADRLVAGHPFQPSDNTDDWLGGGVYFWEYAPKQAWRWATRFKKFDKPAVVGAMIRLGNCFDLLDPSNVQSLKTLHAAMMKKWRRSSVEIPENGNQHKKLDCAIFNQFYRLASEASRAIDTARAVYVPTESAKRIWKRSWIYEEAHIQICVCNQ